MKTERMAIRIAEDVKNRYQAQADLRGVPLATWTLNAMAEQYDREQTTGLLKIRKRDIYAPDEYETEGFATRDMSDLVGREYYLLETQYNMVGQGNDHWTLSDEPGRGNMSGAIKLDGWLGTTNDVARFAHGRVVVCGQSRTHIHLGTLPATDEA